MGEEGQHVPEMTDDWVNQISERYIELFEKITGKTFQKKGGENIISRIEKNVTLALQHLS
jgi:phosphoribosylaminoimidazole-succinocarboxamide synthase